MFFRKLSRRLTLSTQTVLAGNESRTRLCRLAITRASTVNGNLQYAANSKEKAGQVEFVGGPRLFDLFKTYWPDYFADEAAAITQHIEKRSRIIMEEEPSPHIGVPICARLSFKEASTFT